MNISKGIHAHPLFKLGRRKSPKDKRNIRFGDLLRAPLVIPRQYDFDIAHPGIPTPMFANDEYGCCVIAGRAHQTLRFELMEKNHKLRISDRDVVHEYLCETGGFDAGLDVAASLKAWRNQGWMAAGRRYFIRAFTEIDPERHEQIRQAVYMDAGVGLGLNLPLTAQTQMQAGRSWDLVVTGGDAEPGSWGGHYVYVCGYTVQGPVCVTWGRKQQMTWSFIDHYCDEAYAMFDAKDSVKMSESLDLQKLGTLLREVEKLRGEKT